MSYRFELNINDSGISALFVSKFNDISSADRVSDAEKIWTENFQNALQRRGKISSHVSVVHSKTFLFVHAHDSFNKPR
jgi:hypothetical protein